MKGALLVAGTHSDAGKSMVTAGICRWLRRQGVRVAPFKAQNMALNSVVARGGFEIGRAQAMQAAAAGIEPEVAMNPILIKPSGARQSQVILMGRPYADVSARSYQELKDELRPVVAEALADLRARYDVVVCEGAGSPAEINLRAADLTNMGLARAANLPVLLVGDIDRGGVFASLIGTLVALAPEDQRHLAGYIINKFRGDESILAPGLEDLERRTGRPTLGVLPFVEDLGVDAEDSLAIETARRDRPGATGTLDVAVVRLRWMSNFTDLDALTHEPGVRVRFTRAAADIARADLVVLPGTKATVEDLERLRTDGLDHALATRASTGDPIIGVCGGYQLLGRTIDDDVESRTGRVNGLGLLPVTTTFVADKVLRPVTGHSALLDSAVGGYEIRHGRPVAAGGNPLIVTADGTPEGCVAGATLGTSWHGVLEHDDARRALLRWVAARRGLPFVPAPHTTFAAERERQLDALGDLVEHHLDTDRLAALIDGGVPDGLPDLLLEGATC
ncbi:cobyric acid synthase [Baekduia soli]|uniref:Cobyric acid synthase n=1 Tax=Baekduia soli TaxID=496014 RepID=A0A5B8U1T5_9ACTN|nr:cobyric acid synthase [Baekduia soli]QEC47024.1 cobyric acid synthase [Baekduia soli]